MHSGKEDPMLYMYAVWKIIKDQERRWTASDLDGSKILRKEGDLNE